MQLILQLRYTAAIVALDSPHHRSYICSLMSQHNWRTLCNATCRINSGVLATCCYHGYAAVMLSSHLQCRWHVRLLCLQELLRQICM